jgi:hypothetical protein
MFKSISKIALSLIIIFLTGIMMNSFSLSEVEIERIAEEKEIEESENIEFSLIECSDNVLISSDGGNTHLVSVIISNSIDFIFKSVIDIEFNATLFKLFKQKKAVNTPKFILYSALKLCA